MNDLLQTHALLAEGLRADPLLCLASAVAWLDPIWKDDEDEWDVPQDEDGTLATALRVTRTAFPDVYAQAVKLLRQGASYADLDRLICGTITDRGIPLDSLEWIGFGVPMPAYGAVLDDPDFYSAHPDVVPVLACFGFSPEPNPYHIAVPDRAYTAGRLIAADLQQHADERWRQVSWLMQWLFSCSGNSSVDYDYETISEFEPLSWDEEELVFAIAIIEEAEDIIADAMAGLAFLNANPAMLQDLRRNIHRIYTAMEHRKGKRDGLKVRLTWP